MASFAHFAHVDVDAVAAQPQAVRCAKCAKTFVVLEEVVSEKKERLEGVR